MLARFAVIAVASCLVAPPAHADEISGWWCTPSGDKSIHVKHDGTITSPGGQPVAGSVRRHHVDFVIPSGEQDAGATFSAEQLNDDLIRVTIAAKGGPPLDAVIWIPCKPVS